MKKNEITIFVIINLIVLVFYATVYAIPSRFGFLIWNVFLALIPLDVALVNKLLKTKGPWILRALCFLIWLAFFPNAMYLLTDFSHLSAIGTGLATPGQYLNYGVLFTGVFIGMLIGLASLELIVETLPLQKWYFKIPFYVILAVVSSAAIYLGRFQRANSWDLVTNFRTLLDQVSFVMNPDLYYFVLVFGLVQLFIFSVYHLIWIRN
ncbi:DUF1361 domain-containing protein [Weissella coleopterorum]|uniref:DUF1361 domain-containing protein n=1 Tax=Weissella coleopterorum TaxID=2714949 RepID=A0A6G8B1H4_9LACO|nr:DUF1361 domain-containing protein [Weissella coleopterorum]QIL51087.1 DUF1361 domain-containing protein [Weissella coleopterorum]